MKRKLKILVAFMITVLFILGCYLIYNMKDEVKPIEAPEEEIINDVVKVKKRQLDKEINEYYYVKFDFSNEKAIMYKVSVKDEDVREGEAEITIYKEANLYLNETELKNYQKNLNKIYDNPYKYSYLNFSNAKDIDKNSNDYYEIEFSDTKYFVYEETERKMFDALFE